MGVMTSPSIPIAENEPFVHPALFYRGLDEYLAGTLPFIEEGLAAAGPVAVAVPGSRLEPLRAALGAAAARVRFLDMCEAGRNPGQIIPGVLRAFADAHDQADRVRIIGEPIWPGRSDVEYPACVQHEALINLAFVGRNVSILCPYDVEGLAPTVLADAEATHPSLIDSGGRRPSTRYAIGRILADYNRPLDEPTQPQTTLSVDGLHGLSQARRLAVAEARRVGLTADRAADLEIAIGELVTNSIEHGGGAAAIRVWHEDDHVIAEVQDTGKIDDPLAGRRPASRWQARGRGLLMVNHLVDLVRVHSGAHGTTIRIYIRT